MTHTNFKQSMPIAICAATDFSNQATLLLAKIEAGNVAAATKGARAFDRWCGDVISSEDTIIAA